MYYLILLVPAGVSAQHTTLQLLSGKIHKKGSSEVIQFVSVQNHTRHLSNQSDMGGNFKIPASSGDTITFSSAGYKPDTTVVNSWMFKEEGGYSVYLDMNIVDLPTLRVGETNNYQLDSLKRAEEYSWLALHHKEKLAGGKTFSDGVGISFSPIAYYSKRERQNRRLRRRLKQEEMDYYIDFKFSRGYVARITRLQGDSLQLFMIRYTPSYAFCRKASTEDIFLYINDRVKKFREGKK